LVAATTAFRHLEILLPALGVSIVAHEGLHLAGYRIFGGVPAGKAKFGFTLWPLTAYIHADEPVTAAAYRRLVAFPGLLLGALPAIGGLLSGSGGLTIYGFFMLISAGGDFAILWKIRALPSDVLVLDHPHRAGCTVLPPHDPPTAN
jgi:hypothetical protein